jgi:hypothetical protein
MIVKNICSGVLPTLGSVCVSTLKTEAVNAVRSQESQSVGFVAFNTKRLKS